jgi:hypothetical protein
MSGNIQTENIVSDPPPPPTIVVSLTITPNFHSLSLSLSLKAVFAQCRVEKRRLKCGVQSVSAVDQARCS